MWPTGAPYSLAGRRRPVHNHVDGVRLRRALRNVDEKTRAVSSGCIHARRDPEARGYADARREERPRDFTFESVRRIDRSRGQRAIQREKKDLFAVSAPLGLRAAVSRNLPLAARGRKRLHVNLTAAGLVRRICDPLAVRGEHAVGFVGRRLKKRKWLVVTGQRKNPDVEARRRIQRVVEDEAPVGGP